MGKRAQILRAYLGQKLTTAPHKNSSTGAVGVDEASDARCLRNITTSLPKCRYVSDGLWSHQLMLR